MNEDAPPGCEGGSLGAQRPLLVRRENFLEGGKAFQGPHRAPRRRGGGRLSQ